jgi:rhodanese-related sulfurtransferase
MKLGIFSEAAALLLLSVLPALFAAKYHPELRAGGGVELRPFEVTAAGVRAWTNPVLWLDVRAVGEFTRNHVSGAVHFRLDDWESGLATLFEQWHPGTRIVVYCGSQSCDLSASVAHRLRTEAGFSDVYFLHGGWEGWDASRR